MFAVRREQAVETRHELQRLEDDMRGAVLKLGTTSVTPIPLKQDWQKVTSWHGYQLWAALTRVTFCHRDRSTTTQPTA